MTNVLFIMADELSTFGVEGDGSRALTPTLARLRDKGRNFTAAYTPSPICVPTRAAIATGRYLHEIGYWSSAEAYDGRVPGWGHRLQDAGIPVTSIGKLHYRNQTDPTGFDQQIEPIHIPDGIGWVRALMRNPMAGYDATAEMAEMIGPGESDYTRFDRRVTQEACAWLQNAPNRPWCTFVSYLSPHYPLIAPEEHFAKYDPKAFESKAEAVPDHPILAEVADFFDHDPYFTPETRGIARAGYYGLCSFLDQQIETVLRALHETGQDRDTLVIFTSDHGEMLGARGFWGKSTMYEASARVPLFIAGPEIAPAIVTSPVSLIDLAPTICKALGVDASEFSGLDVLDDPDPGRTVLSEYHDGGASVGITMVRWQAADGTDWKYVHYAQGHPPQLFNLTGDPGEINDLSASDAVMLAEGQTRMNALLDPEATDARAHADQAALVDKLGGREKLLAMDQWNFTPADSQ